MNLVLESSRSRAMRTGRLRPKSPLSHEAYPSAAGAWCACPSVSKGRRTFGSAMQRTRLAHFGALEVFGVQALDGLRAGPPA